LAAAPVSGSGNRHHARMDEQGHAAGDSLGAPGQVEPPFELKSYVCVHVFDGSRPVLYVTRPDGSWCFLGGDDHPDEGAAYRVVGIGHVIERDTSLREVLDLEPNQEAERSAAGAI
jgi:hypothetical protein